MNKKFLLASIVLASLNAHAADELVIGEGRSPIGAGNAAAIRGAAKQEAVRDAVLKAIKDATALDASDDKFAGIVNEVAKQTKSVKVLEETAIGPEFVTKVEVLVDRKQIKNAIRGTDLDKLNDRSFSILLIVDEFLTNTKDLNAPLEELVEYKYDTGSSYKDKSLKAKSSSSANSGAVSGSSSLNASATNKSNLSAAESSKANINIGGDSAIGSGNAAVHASASSSEKLNATSQYSAGKAQKEQASYIDKKSIDSQSHETESYKRLVKYQDNSKPVGNSQFLNDFSGRLRDYDLRLLDASVTKSQFWGDKSITLSTLQNSSEIAKFSSFARTKANADFLMIGSASVIAGEKNSATGEITCVANVELKAFSTTSNELIAGVAETTQASSANIEGCAAIATQKVSKIMAPAFTSNVLGYWADRAARGRQYLIELKGTNMSLPMRLSFMRALKEIDGVGDIEKREDTAESVKATITIKGKMDAMEQVYGAVSAQPAFTSKTLDGKSEGELITLCIDTCQSAQQQKSTEPVTKPASKKKK